jgi:chromosome segregation ATPase
MEQIIAFVLGITTGLLAIMLISSFIGMLKMRKQIEQLQNMNQGLDENIGNLNREIDDRFNDTHRSIENSWVEINQELNNINRELTSLVDSIQNELHRRIDEVKEEEHRIRYEDFNTVMKRIDELNRYVDSRFDKAVDGLCTRMDTMFVQKETDTTILKS